MNRDQIDDLMRENGIVVVGEAVYALVQLVIEHEREACAKVCEDFADQGSGPDGICTDYHARLIRAREKAND